MQNSQTPLQSDLSGAYKFNNAKLELLPIRFTQHPAKGQRIVHSIRLGQSNKKLLWVNHKDYSVATTNVVVNTHPNGLTTFRFVYNRIGYEFTVDLRKANQEVNLKHADGL